MKKAILLNLVLISSIISAYSQERRIDTNYYYSGQIESIDRIDEKGNLQGPWTRWHDNGEVYITGNFKDGKREGEWTLFYDERNEKTNERAISEVFQFSKDLKNGVYKSYYENGYPRAVGAFNQGNRTGKWKFYNSWQKLQLDSTGSFTNDVKSENWTIYQDTSVQSTGEYKEGKKTGEWKEYNTNQNHLSKSLHFDNGLLNGLAVEFDFDGDTIDFGNYINGKKEGQFIAQYSDSKTISNYLNNLLHGEYIYYYEGTITEKRNYLNGRRDGLNEEFTTEGVLKSKTWYAQGLVLKKQTFSEIGEITSKETHRIYPATNLTERSYIDSSYFSSHELFGGSTTKRSAQEYILVDKKPKTQDEVYRSVIIEGRTYVSSEFINSSFIHTDKNGEISEIGTYSNLGIDEYVEDYYVQDYTPTTYINTEYLLKNDSILKRPFNYYSNGNLLSKGNINNGLLEGEWILFFSNGDTAQIAHYSSGEPSGKWQYYNSKGDLIRAIEIDKNNFGKEVRTDILSGNSLTGDFYVEFDFDEYDEAIGIEEPQSGPFILPQRKVGTWVYANRENEVLLVEEYGEEIEKINWMYSPKNNNWQFTSQDSSFSCEGVFNPRKNGEWNYYGINKHLDSTGYYQNGVKIGKWKHYSDSKLIKVNKYNNDGLLDGPQLTYVAGKKSSKLSFKNGQLTDGQYSKIEGSDTLYFYTIDNGLKTGFEQEFENGSRYDSELDSSIVIMNEFIVSKTEYLNGRITRILEQSHYEYEVFVKTWEPKLNLYSCLRESAEGPYIEQFYLDDNNLRQDSLSSVFYDQITREFYRNDTLIGLWYSRYSENSHQIEHWIKRDLKGNKKWEKKLDSLGVLIDSTTYTYHKDGLILSSSFNSASKPIKIEQISNDTLFHTSYYDNGSIKSLDKYVKENDKQLFNSQSLLNVLHQEWDSTSHLVLDKRNNGKQEFEYYPNGNLKSLKTNSGTYARMLETYAIDGSIDSIYEISSGINYDTYEAFENKLTPLKDTIISGNKVWLMGDNSYSEYGAIKNGKNGPWTTIKKLGEYNEYYEADSIITDYQNGVINGVQRYFHQGNLVNKSFYNHGQLTKEITFDQSGDTASITKIAGPKTRTYRYLENGNIVVEAASYSFYSGNDVYSEGFYGELSPKGDTVSGGLYQNAKKEGLWRTEEGQDYNREHGQGYYRNDLKEGKWEYLSSWDDYDSQEVLYVGNYKQGLKEGEWKKFRYDKLERKESYKNGVLKDVTEYNEGKPGFTRRYEGDKKVETYFNDSTLEVAYRAHYYKEVLQKIDDVQDLYFGDNYFGDTDYERGVKRYKKLVFDSLGRIDGLVEEYYWNGLLYRAMKFKNGIKQGSLKIYFNDGKLQQHEHYKNDTLNGHYISYFQNNQIQEEGEFLNGIKVGIWKSYDIFGQETSYVDYDQTVFGTPLRIVFPVATNSNYQLISKNGKYALFNDGNLWDLEANKIIRSEIENSIITSESWNGELPSLASNGILSNTGVFLTKENEYSNLLTAERYSVDANIVEFSLDDKYILTQSIPGEYDENQKIKISVINTLNREEVISFYPSMERYSGAAFSGDGKIVYEVQKNKILHRSTQDGSVLKISNLEKELNSYAYWDETRHKGRDLYVIKNDQLLICDLGNSFLINSNSTRKNTIRGIYTYNLQNEESNYTSALNTKQFNNITSFDINQNSNLAFILSFDEYADSAFVINNKGKMIFEKGLSQHYLSVGNEIRFQENDVFVRAAGSLFQVDLRRETLNKIESKTNQLPVYYSNIQDHLCHTFYRSMNDSIPNRYNIFNLKHGSIEKSFEYNPKVEMGKTVAWNLEYGHSDIVALDSALSIQKEEISERDTVLINQFIENYPLEHSSFYFPYAKDNKLLLLNSELHFVNLNKQKPIERHVYLMTTSQNDYLYSTPDHYYMGSKGLKDALYFEKDLKTYPFEQFDLKYNRPDIILDRLGYADSALVDAYHAAYQKRLKKMGFTEDMLKDDFHLPEIKIENFEAMPTLHDQGSIDLKLKIEDSKYKLDRINVWVNDVAVYGSNGISLRDKNVQDYATTLSVDLAKGKNKVQVSVLNQAGAESYKETFEIVCTVGKSEPNLYLITIGESEFEQADFNLTYAAKDAQDIAALFEKSKAYGEVKTKTLVNQEVTKEKIMALKSFLAEADINDEVMIFIAGHGVLDANLDYFFATYDMDFQNPANKGLAYEDLESLLDGIKPLKKTLMIDACHSGEIDKDEVELAEADIQEDGEVQFRAVGNTASPKLGMQNTSELTKSLFTDLRKGTGATVISSAGGMEFAMEGDDWSNGLFTYCFINGIKTKAADYDNNGEIWLSEIKRYVSEQVTELSNGKQQPTSRIENQMIDFRIW